MPPLTAKQKADLSQFMAVTGMSEKVATKTMKAYTWKLELAVQRCQFYLCPNEIISEYQYVYNVDINKVLAHFYHSRIPGNNPMAVSYPFDVGDLPNYPTTDRLWVQDSWGTKYSDRKIGFMIAEPPRNKQHVAPKERFPDQPRKSIEQSTELPWASEFTFRMPLSQQEHYNDAADWDYSRSRRSAAPTPEELGRAPAKQPLIIRLINTQSSFYEASGLQPQAKEKDTLGKLFEKYRNPKTDEVDTVSVEGTMKYLEDLGLSLDRADILVAFEIVQSPAMGEMTKDGFVNGWKTIGAETITKQKAYVTGQVMLLKSDMALFKRVYRHTFICSKEKGQKALEKDTALIYWGMLFNTPGKPWVTGTTNWIDMWEEFLNAKWSKSINKDMWNQTFEFFLKTMQDETLGFWSEDGAWPGVIDDFVAYAKGKRGDLPETMETDD